jgi:predicted nucleic acid-binding protein
MLLVDSSAWIGHLRDGDPVIEDAIRGGELCTHEFVIAELALGSLPNRQQFLVNLRRFSRLATTPFDAILTFVENKELSSTGIGFVDASLLASAAAGSAALWTRDKKLAAQAERLGLAFNPA